MIHIQRDNKFRFKHKIILEEKTGTYCARAWCWCMDKLGPENGRWHWGMYSDQRCIFYFKELDDSVHFLILWV